MRWQSPKKPNQNKPKNQQTKPKQKFWKKYFKLLFQKYYFYLFRHFNILLMRMVADSGSKQSVLLMILEKKYFLKATLFFA